MTRAKAPKIVLLDDTPEIFDLYRLLLYRLFPDVHIRAFTHGLNASHYLAAVKVDLLITDLNHPLMDGLQLLDHLAGKGICTPALVISATGLKQEAETRSVVARQVLFLPKPFTIEQFNEAVKQLL